MQENVDNDLSLENNQSRLIVLHDTPSTDLTHLQAKVWSQNGKQEQFSWLDWVKISQSALEPNGRSWIGTIIQPNQNISIVGNRFDPTILHGLELMQLYPNVQAVESVQVYDILILGEYDGRGLTTLRTRPLPGAIVQKVNAEEVGRVVGLPPVEGAGVNVIGELMNADKIPLCINGGMFNYHFMVSGGTGSGKSNAAANLVHQAVRYNKCVMIHDAKPDYQKIGEKNTDSHVDSVWQLFQQYALSPKGAENVIRVGFYGLCDPKKVNMVVGFQASDFNPEMLASLFFPNTSGSSAEANAFEGFVSATSSLRFGQQSGTPISYSVDEILIEVKRRRSPNPSLPPERPPYVVPTDS